MTDKEIDSLILNLKSLIRKLEKLKSKPKTRSTKHLVRYYKPVICVETGQEFESVKQASIFAECSKASISMCCRGKMDTVRGYHFEYLKNQSTIVKVS